MFHQAVTWFLLLNLLNTLFFAEVPTRQFPSEKARVYTAGADSVIDSLVEFVRYWLGEPGLMAEEDFDDTPDHIKRNQFLEFFLLPLPSPLAAIVVVVSRCYAPFQEPLSSLFFDVFSPPPQA
jgi:hypothetical protein